MLARVAMPAVRQKRSKLAPTSCQASSMVATGTTAADVVGSFMALLSFVDSAPRAYRLKVGNACPTISTSNGTSPPGEAGWGCRTVRNKPCADDTIAIAAHKPRGPVGGPSSRRLVIGKVETGMIAINHHGLVWEATKGLT